MSPAVVRRQPKACVEAVLTWLIDLHHATATSSVSAQGWYKHLIERPLDRFERVFPLCAEEKCLLERTRVLIAPLHDMDVPLVFEHGDLSAPNLLLHGKDRLGVVDWELAEPQGLPAVDLFFFLTYIAFARRRFRTQRHYRAAFHNAFFGPTAWARPYVRRYAEHMHLSPLVLKPLFILCWSRYVANIVLRLNDLHGPKAELSNTTAAWLRTNRYYTLWRHTVDHAAALNV
jgi:aminoglycoside phosphotransferase (APT) family kinase protein